MSWNQKKVLDNIFMHYGITPGKVTRTNSPSGVLEMLKLGMGVSFFSWDLRNFIPDIKCIKIDHTNPATKCHVAAATIPYKRPIIAEFMEFVRKTPRLSDVNANK